MSDESEVVDVMVGVGVAGGVGDTVGVDADVSLSNVVDGVVVGAGAVEYVASSTVVTVVCLHGVVHNALTTRLPSLCRLVN